MMKLQVRENYLQSTFNTVFLMPVWSEATVATDNQISCGSIAFSVHQVQIIICFDKIIVDAVIAIQVQFVETTH